MPVITSSSGMSSRDCCHSSRNDDSALRDDFDVGLDGRRRHGFRISRVGVPQRSSSSSGAAVPSVPHRSGGTRMGCAIAADAASVLSPSSDPPPPSPPRRRMPRKRGTHSGCAAKKSAMPADGSPSEVVRPPSPFDLLPP